MQNFNSGFPTLVSLGRDQCTAVREGLRCMQREGHRTWHRNEMPETYCVIWPGWQHSTPEQIDADMRFMLGWGPRDAE